MYGLSESAFSLLKVNERSDFLCNPLYSSLIPSKKAKLELYDHFSSIFEKRLLSLYLEYQKREVAMLVHDSDVMD